MNLESRRIYWQTDSKNNFIFMSRGSKRFQSSINYPVNFILRNEIKKILTEQEKISYILD